MGNIGEPVRVVTVPKPIKAPTISPLPQEAPVMPERVLVPVQR